ncbi:MAG: hypothetical protein FWE05_11775 [Defluviitaleaceae bacterium]|nr:hypothetical protein [Defluviitaleaceae bacterium]
MQNKIYDIGKLSESSNIDMEFVRLFFSDNNDYFDALTDFICNYRRYLDNYTPDFVINNSEDTKLFLMECYIVRICLMSLGLTLALKELNYIEEAVYQMNFKSFSDGQARFKATIDTYKQLFKEAQL